MNERVQPEYGRPWRFRDLVVVIGTLVGLIASIVALGGIVAAGNFMEKTTPIGDFFQF